MKFALFLLSVISLPGYLLAQELRLPCEARQLAVAGDGSGVWFVCPPHRVPMKPSGSTNRAMPETKSQNNQTEAYWLPTATNVPVRIESLNANLFVHAASSGSRAVIVRTPGSGPRRALLYDKQLLVKELPIDPSFVLWSADSQKLYFYGGSTMQADAWNILGAYDIETGVNHANQIAGTDGNPPRLPCGWEGLLSYSGIPRQCRKHDRVHIDTSVCAEG